MKNEQLSAFVEEIIFITHPDLTIVAYDEDVLIGYDKQGKIHYFYEIYEGLSMCFNLLSEVGAIYQQWFIDTIKKEDIKIETIETEDDYYDAIKQ